MFSIKKLATAIATGMAALTGTAQAKEYYSDIILLKAGSTYTFPKINVTGEVFNCLSAYQQFPQTNATPILLFTPPYGFPVPTPSGAYIPFDITPYEVDPKFGGNIGCNWPSTFSDNVITNPSSVDIVLSFDPLLSNEANILNAPKEQLHEAPLQGDIVTITIPPVVALEQGKSYKLQTNIKEGNVTCLTQTVDSTAAVTFNTNIQLAVGAFTPLRATVNATTSGNDYIDITPVNAPIPDARQKTSILVSNKGPATAFLSCFKDVSMQESPSATA
ncbi:MAG: hypothetical protein K0Q57_534 [Gammaproteobacteria bacterium]|jgi:hypothetical protein|nr:hypothetical protein [Gammaproteobacteria bacterium]